MPKKLRSKPLSSLFKVKSGDFHATKELDVGTTPLISCGESDNGFVGYYDIPRNKIYKRAITVAYNGQPLTTKFHPYKFGAKDDVAILIPSVPLKDTTLLYIAALIDRNKWRYSYGRKCFREKLSNLSLLLPMLSGEKIDEKYIERIFSKQYQDFIPRTLRSGIEHVPKLKWRNFNLTEIFIPQRGDFHSITDLDIGDDMTVSRVSSNNGVVGYFDRPQDARKYQKGCLTISTVGGDAFVQLDDFIATDNVIVCVPKKKLRASTLFFISFMLDRQKWRYSYGRQCYMNKIPKISFYLPVVKNDLDEDGMEKVIEQSPYWNVIKSRLDF
jgi:hypothetical protein